MKFEDYFLKIAQSCYISILKMIYKMTNKLKFIANDWVSLRIRAGSMKFFANDINSNVMLNEIPIWWSIPAENNNNVQMSIKCAGLINEMLPLFCVGFKYPWKNFLCSVLLISNLTHPSFDSFAHICHTCVPIERMVFNLVIECALLCIFFRQFNELYCLLCAFCCGSACAWGRVES